MDELRLEELDAPSMAARCKGRRAGGQPRARSAGELRILADLAGHERPRSRRTAWRHQGDVSRHVRGPLRRVRRAKPCVRRGEDLGRSRKSASSERPQDRATFEKPRADAGTRTPDPFITSEVLYQLSYVGAATDASGAPARAASRDSPCFSQKAGPIPRISISSRMSLGRLRSTSSSTAFAATV